MMDFREVLAATAAIFAAGAASSAWTGAVIVANAAFDGLDAGRADRQLRRVIASAAGFQAGLLGVATGAALFAGARAAAIVAALTALGFLSNIWTLSPRKEKTMPGASKRTKSARMLAVSLTLIFMVAALTSAVLAVVGI
jgi:hypothetical protein